MPTITLIILSLCILGFIAVGGVFLLRSRSPLKTRQILIVDDAPIIQMMMSKVLSDLGCQYDVAADGREALRLIDHKRYDLIFMDCHMPVLDGFIATQAIRELPGTTEKDPVIVALTGDTEENNREKCFQVGMNDYVPKPFRYEQIDGVIKKWLNGRTLRAA